MRTSGMYKRDEERIRVGCHQFNDASLAKTTQVLLVHKMAGAGCVPSVRVLKLTKAFAPVTPLSMRETLLSEAFPPSGSNGRNRKLFLSCAGG